MTLNPKNLGLAGGIIWGVAVLILTIVSMGTGYGANFLNALAGIYPGYTISAIGSLIGLVYGFIDVFIGFYLLARLYNWLEDRSV